MSYKKKIDKSDILRYENTLHSPTTINSTDNLIEIKHIRSGSAIEAESGSMWNYLRSWYYCSGSFPEWKGSVVGSSQAGKFLSPYLITGRPNGQYLTKFNTSASVINIPQKYFGDYIKPGTFKFRQNVHNGLKVEICDDSVGNLYSTNALVSQSAEQSESGSLNHVGNIWYDQGMAVLTETGSWSGSFSYMDLGDGSGSNSNYSVDFESTHTMYTTEYNLRIEPHEFLATSNPTSRAFITGSSNPNVSVSSSFTSSPYLKSYLTGSVDDFVHFTSVQLLDEDGIPVIVANYPRPIRSDSEVPIILKLRLDSIM